MGRVSGCPNSSGDEQDEQHSESGFRCVFASEWDKYATAVYHKNFPETPLSTGDIREVEASSIPNHDLLCAGFPCQAFSVAGKRRGFEEARGTLFFEVARIAAAKRPKMLLLENVKGLLSHDGDRTFGVILGALDELGYRVEWQVLNSKYHGVPQNRERVFIIGHLGEPPSRTVFPVGEVGEGDYEAGERATARALCGGGHSGGMHNQMTLLVQPVLTPSRPVKRQSGRRFKDAGEEMFTLTGQDQHGVMIHSAYSGVDGKPRIYEDVSLTISTPAGGGHLPYVANCVDTTGYLREMGWHEIGKHGLTDYRIRRLTPTECERLQGFPDGWTSEGLFPDGSVKPISDTQRYKMMGNAVTVNVIRFLGERILNVWGL